MFPSGRATDGGMVLRELGEHSLSLETHLTEELLGVAELAPDVVLDEAEPNAL